MQKITTHLWFDKEASEAADFYVRVFPNSEVKSKTTLRNTPSGDVEIVNMEIGKEEFTLLSAGPLFKFNPSVSFLVAYKDKEEVDKAWEKLLEGGKILMELGTYPFSERYGWVEDRYGLSWQLMHTKEDTERIVTPTMMFVGENAGKAEEAINFYTSIFKDSKKGGIMRYEKGEEPDKEGDIKHAEFSLEGQKFMIMDSRRAHGFNFNEAISFMVHCKNQEEIDYYWDKLSAVPESEQCGWLKDKFGFSWQIVPEQMEEMMKGDQDKIDRVTKAFLKMKKFDLKTLEEAANG